MNVKGIRVALMIALTLLILPAIAHPGIGMPALTWARTYGGTGDDLALSVEQTSDGGFVVAGGTKSFGAGEEDAWVLRLDSTGNVVWQKTYGAGEARSIQQTSDGGFIVAGFTGTFSPVADAWVFRLDASGGVVWSMTYGGGDHDVALSVQQTFDGGFVVAGHTRPFGLGSPVDEAWILRLDSFGGVIWTKTYGGPGFSCDEAQSVQQTSDGGFIFVGRRDPASGCTHESPDAWVVRLNPDGTIAWEETFGVAGASDYTFSVQQTSDGGFIVAGLTESSGAGGSDFWVLRLDASGGVVWQKAYGGTGNDLAVSVQQSSDGGFIVAGFTSSFGAGNFDFWVLRLDSIGNAVWQKTYGGTGDDEAFSVQQTSDGGFIVAGFTGSFGAGGLDASVLRLDAQGEISSECALTGPSSATITSTTFVGTPSAPTVTSPSTTGTTTSQSVTDTSAATESQCEGPPVTLEVSIDIKPGSFPNSINVRSSGTIPVAILSGPTLDSPSQVDTSSLTFGRTGDENSLAFCSPSPEDVNGDGLLDLVCHFTTSKTGFQSGDTQGVLRGQLIDGTPIEGRDSVRIVTGGGGRASAV